MAEGSRSPAEKTVIAALVTLAVYAATAAWWFIGCGKSWEDSAKRLARAEDTYLKERKTIAGRAEWERRYAEEASQIPVVEAGQGSDTFWMGVMDEIAKKNNIFVTERKPGREEEAGDMQQVTVDIRWTGAVESLVKFMYELENTPKGKFDVQSLGFSPGKKKGYMSGTMTLVCIFKRKD